MTSARSAAIVLQFDSPDNTPEQNENLAAQTAVANAWAGYHLSVVQARVDRLVAETAAHAVRAHAEADAWKQRTDILADAIEAHANQVAAQGAAWASDAAQAERNLAESSADAQHQWVVEMADAQHQYSQAEAIAYKALAHANAEAYHEYIDKLADILYQAQVEYWPQHMINYIQRANANEIRLNEEMQALAQEDYEQALADAQRAENEAESRRDRFKTAAARDKEFAIKAIKTGVAKSNERAQKHLDMLISQPLSYFEARSTSWEDVAYWIQNDSIDWLINDGLDIATDFFVGAANGLTLGYFSTIVDWSTDGRLLSHVHQDSWSFFAGNISGMALSFVVSAGAGGGAVAGHVGWAYNAAKGYTATTTLVGTGESIYHLFRGNADWTHALNLIPLGGAIAGAGSVGAGFRIFKCFVGDTPVVVGYEKVTTQVSTADFTQPLDTAANSAVWLAGSCLVVGAGGWWLLRGPPRGRSGA